MKHLRRWIARFVDWRLETIRRRSLAHGPREQMHGLTVVTYPSDAGHARALLDRVRAALDLVARHDPKSLASMRDHFDHVQVFYTLGAFNAQYLHAERLCLLSGEYVERESTEPARLAMTLIHELTHARHLSRPNPQPLSVAQAEWLSIGAELAFVKKVPGTARLQNAARKRLERRPDFYERPAQKQRDAEFIHRQNLPRWMMWIGERLAGRTIPPPAGPPDPLARP